MRDVLWVQDMGIITSTVIDILHNFTARGIYLYLPREDKEEKNNETHEHESATYN